jgi:PAS domain S-box-containing protein
MAEDKESNVPGGRKYKRDSSKAVPIMRPDSGRADRRSAGSGPLESNASHRVWLEELREGIVIGQADPLRLVYSNPAMAAITGYTAEELTVLEPGRLEALIHPDDRLIFFERFRQRLAGQAPPAQYEFRGVRKDGSVIWLAIHATRIEFEGGPAVLAAFTDITDLKRIENELRESETKLKAQYKAIPVPTYTWQKRGEDFVLVDYNDAAGDFTRGKIEDYIGITVREMYKDIPEIICEMEQCFQGKKSIEREMEYRLRTTGETKNLVMKYTYVPLDLVLVHTEDITARATAEMELREHREHLEERIEERTAELRDLNERLNREIIERRKTEAELRESETRYRAIVEDQTELICRFTPEYVLTFVNENYCRLFNAEPGELLGRSFMPMISKEDQELVKSQIKSLSSDNPVLTHDQRTLLPNGEVIWQQWTNRIIFDETGRISEYQAVGRDITKRKEAEEELERSNRELGVLNEINNIVNASADSMTILQNMLMTIADHCGARYAGLFEVDHERRELHLVASCGLPAEIRERVRSVGMRAASVQQILSSSGVIVAEEDLLRVQSDEYDSLKEMLDLKRIIAFVSRSRGVVNFLAFLGRMEDEDVGERIRNFLTIVGNQLGIALERLRLLKALEKSRKELKQLTFSLFETIEEERRRMALRLHDDMGQSLVALNVEFDLLEKRVLAGETIDEGMLASIREQLRDITESTRQISYSLHPPMLEDLGLVPALQRYVERFIVGENLTVDFEASGFDEKLPRQISLTLYRVAQEALTNIVRHAGASHAVVQLTKGYPRVIMKIEDNGRGFAFGKEPPRQGLGIVGMRERIERLGGDFRILTNPGKGTRIRVTLPLEV